MRIQSPTYFKKQFFFFLLLSWGLPYFCYSQDQQESLYTLRKNYFQQIKQNDFQYIDSIYLEVKQRYTKQKIWPEVLFEIALEAFIRQDWERLEFYAQEMQRSDFTAVYDPADGKFGLKYRITNQYPGYYNYLL